jgi:hypothetical protein
MRRQVNYRGSHPNRTILEKPQVRSLLWLVCDLTPATTAKQPNMHNQPISLYHRSSFLTIRVRQALGRVPKWHTHQILLLARNFALRINVLSPQDLDVRILLEYQHDIRASKLEMRDLVPLLDLHIGLDWVLLTLLGLPRQLDGGHLGHTDGQDGHVAKKRVIDNDAATGLEELIPGLVGGVKGAQGLMLFTTLPLLRLLGDVAAVRLQSARLGVRYDLEVGEPLDYIGLDDGTADGGVLPVVVEGVEEGVHPGPALEVACVLARLQEVADVPLQVLDVDLLLVVDRPGAVEGAVGRVDHDAVVVGVTWVSRADGAHSLLQVTGEELVEVLPALFWHQSLAIVVLGRVLEGLDGLLCDGRVGVHPVADLVCEVDSPLAQGSQRLTDGFWKDLRRVDGSIQRRLVQDEVEEAQRVVDEFAVASFGRNPFEHTACKKQEVLRIAHHPVIHLRDVLGSCGLNGLTERIHVILEDVLHECLRNPWIDDHGQWEGRRI